MPQPLRHLSLFLAKKGVDVPGLLRKTDELTRHELETVPGVAAALFTKTTESETPWWIEFLDPLSTEDLAAPTSRATSAVLLIKLANRGPYTRVVCYAFGHGRHFLDPAKLERDFGLRVALNSVNPGRLRGIDARRQEDVVVNSRLQASAGTDLSSFDINHFRDMFRSASGHTRPTYEALLGHSVKGSVSVTFDVPIEAGKLEQRAKDLIRIYRKDDYRSDFSFVDNIQPVGPTRSEELDEMLDEALRALSAGADTEFRCLYLAPPEILDEADIEGFMLSTEDDDERPKTDLDLDIYLESRRPPKAAPSVERSRRDIVSIRTSGGTARTLASVYRCIVGEVDLDGDTYQIVDGNWYELERNFVTRVRADLETIPSSGLDYPAYESGTREDDWNERAAKALGGVLLDKKNVPIGGGSNRIELCDVGLAPDTLVHVKRRSSSSTLSHLWSQGAVSLQALLTDEEFRRTARRTIEDIDETHVDLANDGAVGGDYAIHFVILGTKTEDVVGALPFFSQVALWQAHRRISGTGASVFIKAVPADQ